MGKAGLLSPRTYCRRVEQVAFADILFRLQREVPEGEVLGQKSAEVPWRSGWDP